MPRPQNGTTDCSDRACRRSRPVRNRHQGESSTIEFGNDGLIAEGKFEPAAFAAPLGYKDIPLALAAAESLRVPMPPASLLHDRFLRLFAQGGEHLDWSAIGGLAVQDADAVQGAAKMSLSSSAE
jgi:3-hydroxyisobutyrate dehydrogenase-like beta-hydroxyacid dehydrogenase